MSAWFGEYYARCKTLPALREHLDDLFGEDRATDDEREEQTSAAARAWNSQFAAVWKAQEAAKAAK